MNPLVVAGIALGVGAVLFVLHKLGVIDFSDKTQKRGSGSVGSGFLGAAFDEVFHPVRYELQLELERQTTLPSPSPEADADPLGVGEPADDGTGTGIRRRVIIELDEHGRPRNSIVSRATPPRG